MDLDDNGVRPIVVAVVFTPRNSLRLEVLPSSKPARKWRVNSSLRRWSPEQGNTAVVDNGSVWMRGHKAVPWIAVPVPMSVFDRRRPAIHGEIGDARCDVYSQVGVAPFVGVIWEKESRGSSVEEVGSFGGKLLWAVCRLPM